MHVFVCLIVDDDDTGSIPRNWILWFDEGLVPRTRDDDCVVDISGHENRL